MEKWEGGFVPAFWHEHVADLRLRTSSFGLLGEVLHFLVTQLASPNPVLRGIASMQIVDITKFQGKTHLYTLFVPYMDRIAPLLVSRIHLDPTFLAEFCRLASMSPANFVEITLSSTLPKVFGQCEKDVLAKIAETVNVKASRMFLDHSDGILAFIFRFERREDREKALSFILWTLKEENGSLSGDRATDIQTIVKSGLVKLLAELVIGLGDENTSVSRSVRRLNSRVRPVTYYLALIVIPSSRECSYGSPPPADRIQLALSR